MRTATRWILAAALAGAAPIAATTATAAEPLWELGAFGGLASTPAYPGSVDSSRRALLLPFFLYRGKVLRVDQQGIGARLVNRDRFEFDVGLAGSLPAKSDDVAARLGMPDLGSLVELGPRAKVTLAQLSPNSRLRLDIPLRAVLELRSGVRTQGYTFEPKLVYELRGPEGAWSFDANVGMVVGDRKVNRYFYEVRPEFALAGRPAYAADGGLMLVRTGVSGSRIINPDLRVFGFVRLESYASAANRDSPLMKKTTGTSVGMGFAWTIKRSAQPAQ